MGCGASSVSEAKYRAEVERKLREAEEEAARARREADERLARVNRLFESNGLFQSLSDDVRRELAEACERVDVLRGERILRKTPGWSRHAAAGDRAREGVGGPPGRPGRAWGIPGHGLGLGVGLDASTKGTGSDGREDGRKTSSWGGLRGAATVRRAFGRSAVGDEEDGDDEDDEDDDDEDEDEMTDPSRAVLAMLEEAREGGGTRGGERKIVAGEFDALTGIQAMVSRHESRDAFYVVDTGEVDVEVSGNVVLTLRQGGGFGELDRVFDAPDLNIVVVAVTPCTLWAIDGRTLRRRAALAMAKQRAAWDRILGNVHLLRALMPLQRAFLSGIMHVLQFKPGNVVATEGDEGEGVWMLMQGEAGAVADLVGGGEKVVATYEPGGNFGEASLVEEGLYFEATVKCGNVDATLGFISREDFTHMFHRNETIWDLIEERMSELVKFNDDARARGGGGGDSAPMTPGRGGMTPGRSPRARTPTTPGPGEAWGDEVRRFPPLIARHGGVGSGTGSSRWAGAATSGRGSVALGRSPSLTPRRGGSKDGQETRVGGDDSDVSFFDEEWETDTDPSDDEKERELTGAETPVHKRLIGAPSSADRGARGAQGMQGAEGLRAKGAAPSTNAALPSRSSVALSSRRVRIDRDAGKAAGKVANGGLWTNSRWAQKKYRRKQPLGPPPDGDERLDRIIDILEHHVVFQGCERRLLRMAVQDMEQRNVEPGEIVYATGDKGDYMYVVEAGELDVLAPSPDGETSPRPTMRVYQGDVIGDLALTYASNREFTLQACSRGAKCWGMRRRWFERVAGPVVFGKRRLIRRFVSHVPILAALPMAEQALVAESMKEALYNAGEIIIAQGAEPDFFFVLEEGQAVATVQVPGQADPLNVANYARGSYFGELAFLRNKPRNATVRALNNCRCAAIEGHLFKVLVGEGTALRRLLLLEAQTYVNSIW